MRFYISLIIFSVIVFAGFHFLQPHLPARIVFPPYVFIQLVMIAVTAFIHSGLQRASAKSGQAFVRYYMGATAIKLLVFMMIIVFYGILNRDTAFAFILNFFIFYLLYTVFEVYFAYGKFGPERKQE